MLRFSRKEEKKVSLKRNLLETDDREPATVVVLDSQKWLTESERNIYCKTVMKETGIENGVYTRKIQITTKLGINMRTVIDEFDTMTEEEKLSECTATAESPAIVFNGNVSKTYTVKICIRDSEGTSIREYYLRYRGDYLRIR
jgi:hypothetical protein